jgi:hypothetical protein
MGDLESISQGRDPQPVPESADAAALKRRDCRSRKLDLNAFSGKNRPR